MSQRDMYKLAVKGSTPTQGRVSVTGGHIQTSSQSTLRQETVSVREGYVQISSQKVYTETGESECHRGTRTN